MPGGFIVVQGRADDTMNLGGIKVQFAFQTLGSQSSHVLMNNGLPFFCRQVLLKSNVYVTVLMEAFWRPQQLALLLLMEVRNSWLSLWY